MTLGELRYLLSKQYPGIDLDVMDGWIADRYKQILDRVPWDRLKVQSMVSLAAEYATGTVEVANGSNAITGTGTTWTTAMTGRMIRFGTDGEWYEFTRVSNTTGTLDREYAGETDADATYRINKCVYTLDSDARDVQSVGLLDPETPLTRQTTADIDASDLNRSTYGTPQVWAPYMDAQTTPALQIEVWPVPTAAGTLAVWHTYDPAAPTTASTALLPWVRVDALKAGVGADALRHGKDYAGGDRLEIRFEAIVREMVALQSQNHGGVSLLRPQAHRMRRYGR